MNRPALWQRGFARASIMGRRETTNNPSPAAQSLLRALGGGRRKTRPHPIRMWSASRARKSLRRSLTGNPVPAAAALFGVGKLIGGKLGARLKGAEAKHAERVATFQEWGKRALLGDDAALAQLAEYATGTGRYTRTPGRARDAAALVLAEVQAALTAKAAEEEAGRAAERKAAEAERRAEQRAARGASAAERAAEREATTARLGAIGGIAGDIAMAAAARGRGPPRQARRRRRARRRRF